jgi:hypothetical protein
MWRKGSRPRTSAAGWRCPSGAGARSGCCWNWRRLRSARRSNSSPSSTWTGIRPPCPPDLLELARFVAGYYQHPLGAVLATLLPPALRRTHATRREAPPAVYRLTEAGRDRMTRLPARATAQAALAARLVEGNVERATLGDAEKTLIRDWLKQGWVEAVATPMDTPVTATGPALTEEQQSVLSTLAAGPAGFAVWLLHGVTGSGKTEVYLRRVAEVVAAGRQALVLVPEIHLTPQLLERFARRFPGRRLICLHSALAEGERRAAWLDALEGRADIVLGTRLAVFTPLPRLGLIVVDEEHDGAYKQTRGHALFRPRRGGLAGPPTGSAGDPGFRHALPGILAQRPGWPLPVAQSHPPRQRQVRTARRAPGGQPRRPAPAGLHRRPADRPGGTPGTGGTEPGVHQPARLCPHPAVQRLRPRVSLSPLYRPSGAAP